jgi:mono/diheme cytochrome c family protein
VSKASELESLGVLDRAALKYPVRSSILALAAIIALVALIAGAFAVLIFVRPAAAGQSTASAKKSEHADAGNLERGKKLYASYGCYECHGRVAQGGVGPRLGPDPLPLSFIEQYVRRPTGSMPPYTAKTVSDQDLMDIYAYLKSLPEPPKRKDIPLLNE